MLWTRERWGWWAGGGREGQTPKRLWQGRRPRAWGLLAVRRRWGMRTEMGGRGRSESGVRRAPRTSPLVALHRTSSRFLQALICPEALAAPSLYADRPAELMGCAGGSAWLPQAGSQGCPPCHFSPSLRGASCLPKNTTWLAQLGRGWRCRRSRGQAPGGGSAAVAGDHHVQPRVQPSCSEFMKLISALKASSYNLHGGCGISGHGSRAACPPALRPTQTTASCPLASPPTPSKLDVIHRCGGCI